MKNLVILTTAITRGKFHEKSIGKFYELYEKIIEKYKVYHIINLDLPEKLKSIYNKEETIKLFNKIIPSSVSKVIIDNNNPGFLMAYKNVVKRVIEMDLNKNSLIWWFEDDWEISRFNDKLFDVIDLFPLDKPFAFNSVISSPLGSFRGGPIMTHTYFNKYFNIESFGIMNNDCDPERQVSRWLSGINRKNGNAQIHRDITNDNVINIIFFYLPGGKINATEYPSEYYNNKQKFNEKLNFSYHAIKSNDLNDYYYSEVKDGNLNFKKTDIDDILSYLSNEGINYVCIKPWVFSDIGRQFNSDHSLKKWATIEDGTSYH